MKKTLFNSTLLCIVLNAPIMAEELDIKLVDESEKSALYQHDNIQGTIVGCNDNALKKELACSKKPKDAILSKLPSSKQIKKVNLDDDTERAEMKKQLSNILTELNHLKEAQKADRNTIKELKSVIADLTKNKDLNHTKTDSKSFNSIISKKIQKITPKKSKSVVPTIIKKDIKEISRTENTVVIEVQKNESLSTYAEAYYGDNRQYYKIYKANRQTLRPDMLLLIGQKLTIPLN